MLFDDINLLSFMNLEPNKENPKLVSSNEGFLKGNLFSNEYLPYKDYKPANLKTDNEREAYLYKVMELNFAIKDLNLYLDLHPQDNEMIKILKKYIDELKKYEKEYETKFGALQVCDIENNYSYINNPWPWEKEDAKYV